MSFSSFQIVKMLLQRGDKSVKRVLKQQLANYAGGKSIEEYLQETDTEFNERIADDVLFITGKKKV